MNRNIHIVPHDGEWAVRFAGAKSPESIHETQQAAIEAAMELAQDEEVDMVIHRRNGSFRNVISHETIERRALEAGDSMAILRKPLVWGIFAAGAATALTVYLALHPPEQLRRYMH